MPGARGDESATLRDEQDPPRRCAGFSLNNAEATAPLQAFANVTLEMKIQTLRPSFSHG